jgi:hypothetical protein
LAAHQGMDGKCSECRQRAPGYDRLPERWWLSVPLWGIVTWFRYAPRRVECAEHGVVVEHIPWSEGKRPITRAMMGFLARWARHLSWRQTSRSFQTSWECVYRSVEWFVQWGLAHRKLQCCFGKHAGAVKTAGQALGAASGCRLVLSRYPQTASAGIEGRQRLFVIPG